MQLLCSLLADPGQVDGWDNRRWNRLLIEARVAGLLGRCWYRLEDAGVKAAVPERVRHHLQGGLLNAGYVQTQARRELRHVSRQLLAADIPIVALKGLAYVIDDLPPAPWRGMSDIDILIPAARLEAAESLLHEHGWQDNGVFDDYDRHYYRQWMHELPPLKHQSREIEVDIHHNLTPPVSRIQIDAGLLWEQARPTRLDGIQRLGDADLVLHNATHLLFNDELRGGLRDLVDFRDLFTHFQGQDGEFATHLYERARQLGCGRPLFYAVHAAQTLLRTPFPDGFVDACDAFAPVDPVRKMTQGLIAKSLVRSIPTTTAEKWADSLLYLRSHWVRMPPAMLARHLLTKALKRRAAPAVSDRVPGLPADQ